jgi:hypothetical protein
VCSVSADFKQIQLPQIPQKKKRVLFLEVEREIVFLSYIRVGTRAQKILYFFITTRNGNLGIWVFCVSVCVC